MSALLVALGIILVAWMTYNVVSFFIEDRRLRRTPLAMFLQPFNWRVLVGPWLYNRWADRQPTPDFFSTEDLFRS